MYRSGLYDAVIDTEVTLLCLALKRGHQYSWSRAKDDDSLHPQLLQEFVNLKQELHILRRNECWKRNELSIDPSLYLNPFLEVIRSEVVSGTITGFALQSVNKFIVCGLLNENVDNIAPAIQSLCEAVTHTRFIGVDATNDERVLMRIVELMENIVSSNMFPLITDECLCEIFQSSFRIAFESRVSVLLREQAEVSLSNMVRRLFSRLRCLKLNINREGEVTQTSPSIVKTKLRMKQHNAFKFNPKSNVVHKTHSTPTSHSPSVPSKSKSGQPSFVNEEMKDNDTIPNIDKSNETEDESENNCDEIPDECKSSEFNVDSDVLARSPVGSTVDLSSSDANQHVERCESNNNEYEEGTMSIIVTSPNGTNTRCPKNEMTIGNGGGKSPDRKLKPHSLATVHELLRFLISLLDTFDGNNTSNMLQTALSLLIVAFETSCFDSELNCSIAHSSILEFVKDSLMRNLVALLSVDRISTFQMCLWLSYIVIRYFRHHIKYQVEVLLQKVIQVISCESHLHRSPSTVPNSTTFQSPQHVRPPSTTSQSAMYNQSNIIITYEHRELALEFIGRILYIPDVITQLYVNYDCGLYTSNLLEDIVKMLAKNAYPLTDLCSINFLSIDNLLIIIQTLEFHTLNESLRKDEDISHENVLKLKKKKREMMTATEQFNSKASKGVKFMLEHGLISKDEGAERVRDIAHMFRYNPHLCKKQVGEFIAGRDNQGVLHEFIHSFDFNNLRLDEALRVLLESFRLPGESPQISLILECFAQHFHESNTDSGLIESADAAYTLAYAIIMLNVDQHNKNHTKTNVPMTVDQFKHNLRETNEGKNHNDKMLEEIHKAIRNEEIVMPDEQSGAIREHYVWRSAMKRATQEMETMNQQSSVNVSNNNTNELRMAYLNVRNGMQNQDIFETCWSSTVAAMSYILDKSWDEDVIASLLSGFVSCASIANKFDMTSVFDHIVLSVYRFTTLSSLSRSLTSQNEVFAYTVRLCKNVKAITSIRTLFYDIIFPYTEMLGVDGWKVCVDCMKHLFTCALLPLSMQHSDNFIVDENNANDEINLHFYLHSPHSSTRSLTSRRRRSKDSADRRLSSDSSPQSQSVSGGGFLSSFVSFISMSSPSSNPSFSSDEQVTNNIYERRFSQSQGDKTCVEKAKQMLRSESTTNNMSVVITDSKYLREESLTMFLNQIMKSNNDLISQYKMKYFNTKLNRRNSFSSTSCKDSSSSSSSKYVISGDGSSVETEELDGNDFDSENISMLSQHPVLVEERRRIRFEEPICFNLQLLISILTSNRDRCMKCVFMNEVVNHLHALTLFAADIASSSPNSCSTSSQQQNHHSFLLERCVSACMSISVKLCRKEDLVSTVIEKCLTNIFLLSPIPTQNEMNVEEGQNVREWSRKSLDVHSLFSMSRLLSTAMQIFTKSNAANIHSSKDWTFILAILQVIGGGVDPRFFTSKSTTKTNSVEDGSCNRERDDGSDHSNWVVVNEMTKDPVEMCEIHETNEKREIVMHDTFAFHTCCQTLAFITRDGAHVTRENFKSCLETIQTFIETIHPISSNTTGIRAGICVNSTSLSSQLAFISSSSPSAFVHCSGPFILPPSPKRVNPFLNNHHSSPSSHPPPPPTPLPNPDSSTRLGFEMRKSVSMSAPSHVRQHQQNRKTNCPSTSSSLRKSHAIGDGGENYSSIDSADDVHPNYIEISLQLLDITHTLISKVYQTFHEFKSEEDMWREFTSPLLTCISTFICDGWNYNVRNRAISVVQKLLMSSDDQFTLFKSVWIWPKCFHQILFPLTHQLVNVRCAKSHSHHSLDNIHMEEIRSRICTILAKIFLQHLTEFNEEEVIIINLWSELLNCYESLYNAALSDNLSDAVPETLKNMLLVMNTQNLFYKHSVSPTSENVEVETKLCMMTGEKLDRFLPSLSPKQLFANISKSGLKSEDPPSTPKCHDPPILRADTFASGDMDGNTDKKVDDVMNYLPDKPSIAPLPPLPTSVVIVEGSSVSAPPSVCASKSISNVESEESNHYTSCDE